MSASGTVEALENVQSLSESLWRNGQVVSEDYVVAMDATGVQLVCLLPRRNSLSTRFCSPYVSKDLSQLRELGVTIKTPQIETRCTYWEHLGSLRGVTSLILNPWHAASPFAAGNKSRRVALYAIPIHVDVRDRIMRWSRESLRFYGVFHYCAALEMESYRELADPASMHAQEGRSLALTVEEAIGVPCYFFLMRHWGRRGELEGKDRRCPGCGGKWLRKNTGASYDPDNLDSIPFRCDRCRLVAEMAYTFDDERHARIGEWRGAERRRRT